MRTYLEAYGRRASQWLLSAPNWLEDPTPYEVIHAVTDFDAAIAAGESCESLLALRGLVHGGVRYLLPDLARLGGPIRQ